MSDSAYRLKQTLTSPAAFSFLSQDAALVGQTRSLAMHETDFRHLPRPPSAVERNLNDRPNAGVSAAVTDVRALTQSLARYRRPNHGRSIVEILITAVPFVLLWISMWWSLRFGYGLYLLLTVPAAGFLVRLFMIQHDCGHGSFFRHRLVNDWVGRVIGVFTLTPYDFWRRAHGIHHATSGNLDLRGIGDIDTLTVREYLALSGWRRLVYRLYRHPIVMFGVGPSYLFILRHRLPCGLTRAGWGPWLSTMATNGAIALVVAGMIWWIGVVPFLLVHLPITILGGAIGVWLFYVQHQFEHTVWSADRDWNFPAAALYGSSYYDLPPVPRWFTANIGMHHIHHLCSRIPFYRLPVALRQHPDLMKVGRLTLGQSFACVRLALWDEAARRLITFRELRTRFARDASDLAKAANIS
jgi:acyl-lipid omega-6 desaturase (Delta-12 desaturase)